MINQFSILNKRKTMRFYIYIVFFLLNSLSLYSQIIKGTVKDSLGQPVFANILIKKSKTSKSVIQYTITDDNGKFSISIKQPSDSLTLEVSSIGFKSHSKLIDFSNSRKNRYSFDIILKEQLSQLNEVVLKTNTRIIIKNDTTIYNPNAFKDGTERTIEDLLKKLPGIEVKTNGEIKFKGKSIKKLMLDGDDLFGSNYTLGSRNIDVNIIDKIQGLDNYEDNPLLKGLQDSNDVALNITLKKGKADVSINNELSYGIENRWKLYTSGLIVSKKIKAFSLLSHNNIGNNNSIYNLNSELLIQNVNKKRLEAKSIITEGDFGSILDDSFHSFNKSLFNSTNTVIKVLKKSSVNINLGFYSNKLRRTNENLVEINDGENQINFFSSEKLTKTPKIFSSQIFFSNKECDSLHWEYNGTLNIENTKFINESNNNSIQQLGRLKSESINTFHNFNIIHRANKNQAIEAVFLYNFSKAPQKLNMAPGTIFDDSTNILLESQNSVFQKNSLESKIALIGHKNWLKYNISSGFNHFYSKLNSLLSSNQNEYNTSLNNDMKYAVNSFYMFPKASINFDKGNLKLGINIQYNILTYEDKINTTRINKNDFIFAPDLSFTYRFTRKTNLNLSYSYNELLPQEDRLYSNIIQTNFRSFSSNVVDLRYIKTNQLSSKLKYQDFYKRTTISLECKYLISEGNYFNQTLINENITVNSSFYNPALNRSYSALLSYESYFHFIKSTLKLDAYYAIILDKNIVNNSELRDLTNRNLQLSFTIRSGFKSKFNFENISNIERNDFEVSNQSNNIIALNNQFKATYKINKSFFSNTKLSYISPDISSSINYMFLETELVFRPENKNYQIALVGKNLTNNKKFETVFVNDYNRSTSSYNLIERYVLLSASFSF